MFIGEIADLSQKLNKLQTTVNELNILKAVVDAQVATVNELIDLKTVVDTQAKSTEALSQTVQNLPKEKGMNKF